MTVFVNYYWETRGQIFTYVGKLWRYDKYVERNQDKHDQTLRRFLTMNEDTLDYTFQHELIKNLDIFKSENPALGYFWSFLMSGQMKSIGKLCRIVSHNIMQK